jgi:hypothetical protein
VRIEFKTEGGIAYFPGLSKPFIVESEQLSEEQAAELERLIRAAEFFDLPDELGKSPPGAADVQEYTVTIQDGKRRHTVHIRDPFEDENVAALIKYLQKLRSSRKPSVK